MIKIEELPKVYVNPIDKEFDNFQKTSDASDRKISVNKKNLSMKLKAIFSSNNYVYKKRVRLTLKDSVREKVVVGKANGYLLTIDGEKIKLSDIYDIEIV